MNCPECGALNMPCETRYRECLVKESGDESPAQHMKALRARTASPLKQTSMH